MGKKDGQLAFKQPKIELLQIGHVCVKEANFNARITVFTKNVTMMNYFTGFSILLES